MEQWLSTDFKMTIMAKNIIDNFINKKLIVKSQIKPKSPLSQPKHKRGHKRQRTETAGFAA
jgi:hypothetical protein